MFYINGISFVNSIIVLTRGVPAAGGFFFAILTLGSTFPLANHCVLQLKFQKKIPPAAGSPANRGLLFLIVYNYIFFNHGLPFSIRNFYIRAGQVRGKSMRAGTVTSVADGLSHAFQNYSSS